MNYKTFLTFMEEAVNELLAPDLAVELKTVTKNNSVRMEGLSLRSGKDRISPVVYLHSFFRLYCDGKDPKELAEEIARCFQIPHPLPSLTTFPGSFEQMAPMLYARLINTEKNRELLKTVPHLAFLDLSLIFHCELPEDDNISNFIIGNDLVTYWRLSPDTFAEEALPHVIRHMSFEFLPIEDVLFSDPVCFTIRKKPSLSVSKNTTSDSSLYVLTNERRAYGASALFFPEILKSVRQWIGYDFFVLPSSIHECLLVPDYPEAPLTNSDEINSLIREVNASEVRPEEILSDHAYYYSAAAGQLSMILN